MTGKHLLSASIFVVAVVATGSGRVYAENPMCQPDKTAYQKTGNSFLALDLRKTGNSLAITLLTDATMNIIAGRNPTQMVQCSYRALKNSENPALIAKADAMAAPEMCPSLVNSPECADFSQTFDYRELSRNGSNLSYIDTQTAGSLLGIANTLEGGIRTEPVPVNLAYYWNRSIEKVPFVNSALAANVTYGNLPSVLMDPIYSIWTIFRNIAFGMLSIIMMIIGIMIMTRRKLSAQVVVTVQYAVPRVALAAILILFSYPLGAVLASSMHYLANLVEGLIYSGVNLGFGLTGLPAIIALLLFDLLVIGIPLNVLGLTLMAILTLIIIVLKIVIAVRAIMLLLKLILSITYSPIQFAMGAIPGNEEATQNVLKRSLAYVAEYVALFAFTATVEAIIIKLASPGAGPALSLFPTSTPSILYALFTPIFLIFGYIQALKVPAKVEAFILGEPKKPARK